MEKIRRQYEFYGRVQGVGFRYRAYHAANSLGVTGYVKNCYDGSVLMQAEGTEAALDQLILTIENGSYIVIENFSQKQIPLQNDHYFEIKD